MKVTSFKLLLSLSALFVIPTIFSPITEANTDNVDDIISHAPPSCYHSNNIMVTIDDPDLITISCSSLERWTIIRSYARLTGKNRYNTYNYSRLGGSRQALNDFNTMPGKTVSRSSGVLTKTYNGETVTYYPKSTSGSVPTLSFPHKNNTRVDKIRYE